MRDADTFFYDWNDVGMELPGQGKKRPRRLEVARDSHDTLKMIFFRMANRNRGVQDIGTGAGRVAFKGKRVEVGE